MIADIKIIVTRNELLYDVKRKLAYKLADYLVENSNLMKKDIDRDFVEWSLRIAFRDLNEAEDKH